MPVRVPGTAQSFSWSGTLTANLAPGGLGPFWGYQWTPVFGTGFNTVGVSTIGVSCGIRLAASYSAPNPPQPGIPYYDEVMTLWSPIRNDPNVFVVEAWVAAGWGEEPKEAARPFFASWGWHIPFDTPPNQWYQVIERLSYGFSIGFDGLVIKREFIAEPPPKRSHMHPKDARIEDAWYLTPEAEATVSFAGMTLTTGPRREAPQFAGMSDAEIGDSLVGDPSIGYGMSRLYASLPGEQMASITIAGGDFSGMVRAFDDGQSEDAIRAYGDGDTWQARYTGTTSKPSSAWSGTMFPGLEFAWANECYLFDPTEKLDPPVWAGFVDPSGQSVAYPLTGLPTAPCPPIVATSGTVYDTLPRWDAHPEQMFRVDIDEEWALRNWLCPGGPVEYIEGDAIEDQSDRYVTFTAPGVNSGVVGGEMVIGSIGSGERAILPLAPVEDVPYGEPDVPRWTGAGEMTEAEGSTLARPRFELPAKSEGSISYQPITRMWDRLALVKEPGTQPSFEWIWSLKAAAEGANADGSPVGEGHPAYPEDVFHWGGASFLRLKFERSYDMPLSLRLVLRYSTIEVYDPHYTCGSWRIEEWDYVRTSATASYSVSIEAGLKTAHVDLLCPDEGNLPRLYVVDEVKLEGFKNIREDEGVWFELTELALESDPAGAPQLTGSVKETWDFFTDWQGMSLARDGNIDVLRWPDDPWRNDGPERGHGYIGPRQHCPTTGLADWLHFARPQQNLGAAGLVEGFTADIDADLLVTAAGPGGVPETLCDPLMYWAANRVWWLGGASIEITAGILVTRQRIARGIPYRFLCRKVLGGAGWGLLKDADGRRVRRGSFAATHSHWRLFSRVAQYADADDQPIAPPEGLPEPGVWTLLHEGGVNANVDQHGLFRTPGLKPSRTRIWREAKGADPGGQTDTARVEYLLQIWDAEGAHWSLYDVNENWSELQDDPAFGSQTTFEIASRRLTPLWVQTAGTVTHGGNLIRSRMGVQLMTRGGRIWRRLGGASPWQDLGPTEAPIPLLLQVKETGDIGLVDSEYLQSSWLGLEWSPGLPNGIPPAVLGWRNAIGKLTDARRARGGLVLAVGVEGDRILVAGGREGTDGPATAEVFEVGTLPEADSDAWPWCYQLTDGRWRVGVLSGGAYHEWRSGDLDGRVWEAVPPQPIGAEAFLTACSFWRGREGLELLAGYHLDAGAIYVFSRAGDGGWTGPYLTEAAPATMPYAYIRRTGPVEVGWLSAGDWKRYAADMPDGDWSPV